MYKTFAQILAEGETQFKYKLVSVKDIQNVKTKTRIELSLLSHRLVSCENGQVKEFNKNNKLFPDYPMAPMYELNITTGLELNINAALQEIALFANINSSELLLYPEGDKPEDYIAYGSAQEEAVTKDERKYANSPMSSNFAFDDKAKGEDLAGEKRIATFLKSLEKDKNKAEKVRDVYESFVVTQKEMRECYKKEFKKGYYLFERMETDVKFTVYGPFETYPENYSYIDNLATNFNSSIIKELNTGNKLFETILVKKLNEETTSTIATNKFEVSVKDLDTSKVFNVVVDAPNKITARNRAIDTIKNREGIALSRLVALNPNKE